MTRAHPFTFVPSHHLPQADFNLVTDTSGLTSPTTASWASTTAQRPAAGHGAEGITGECASVTTRRGPKVVEEAPQTSHDGCKYFSACNPLDFAARLNVGSQGRRNLLSSVRLLNQRNINEELSMTVLKPVRVLGTAAILATIPLLSAIAQTQSPPPSDSSPPPAVTKPEATMPPAQREVMPPTSPNQKTVASPSMVAPSAGLAVLTSDGSKLGTIRSVKAGPDGKVSTIYLKTGGFLGFGGKVVAIPNGKFTRKGDVIQLSMSADEVSKLPEAMEPN